MSTTKSAICPSCKKISDMRLLSSENKWLCKNCLDIVAQIKEIPPAYMPHLDITDISLDVPDYSFDIKNLNKHTNNHYICRQDIVDISTIRPLKEALKEHLFIDGHSFNYPMPLKYYTYISDRFFKKYRVWWMDSQNNTPGGGIDSDHIEMIQNKGIDILGTNPCCFVMVFRYLNDSKSLITYHPAKYIYSPYIVLTSVERNIGCSIKYTRVNKIYSPYEYLISECKDESMNNAFICYISDLLDKGVSKWTIDDFVGSLSHPLTSRHNYATFHIIDMIVKSTAPLSRRKKVLDIVMQKYNFTDIRDSRSDGTHVYDYTLNPEKCQWHIRKYLAT